MFAVSAALNEWDQISFGTSTSVYCRPHITKLYVQHKCSMLLGYAANTMRPIVLIAVCVNVLYQFASLAETHTLRAKGTTDNLKFPLSVHSGTTWSISESVDAHGCMSFLSLSLLLSLIHHLHAAYHSTRPLAHITSIVMLRNVFVLLAHARSARCKSFNRFFYSVRPKSFGRLDEIPRISSETHHAVYNN